MEIAVPKIVLGIIGPEVVLVITALGIMVADLVVRQEQKQQVLLWMGILGIVGAMVVGITLWGQEAVEGFSGMVVVDKFSTFFTMVFLVAGAMTLLMSSAYVGKQGVGAGEYYVLIVFATFATRA